MGLDVTATYNRASELCLTKKLTSAGQIKASAGKLFWLLLTNASTSARVAILHDDLDATDDEIAPFRVVGKASALFNFDPPIPCDTGIRIGQMDGDLTILGGYV